jgi:hypothetical protein
MIGGVAVAAAAQTFPFRVFSFPTEISLASRTATGIATLDGEALSRLTTIYYDKRAIELLKENLKFHSVQPLNGNFYGCVHPVRFKQFDFKSA